MKNINKLDLLSELMRDSSESISTEGFSKILAKYNLSLKDNDEPSENEKQFHDAPEHPIDHTLPIVDGEPKIGKDKSPISLSTPDYDYSWSITHIDYINLVKKAKGDRTVAQYSAESGASAAHISRTLRGLITDKPRLDTIKLLASSARNGVRFQDLVEAAGYGVDNGCPSFEDVRVISLPDYDGTCEKDINDNPAVYEEKLKSSNHFSKLGDTIMSPSFEDVDYAAGMRFDDDCINSMIKSGSIRDPKYGEVLKGKITYAEYAKTNQIIILKQRMKMLSDRLVWYKGGLDNHVLNKYKPVYFRDLVNYYQLHLDCNNKEVLKPFWERAIDIINILPVNSEIMKSSNLTLEQKSIYTIINFLFHRGKRPEEVFFSIVRSQFKPNTLIRPDEELFKVLKATKEKPTSFMELTLDSRLMPLEFIKYLHLVVDVCSRVIIPSNAHNDEFYKLRHLTISYLNGEFSSMTLRELINPDYPKFKFNALMLTKIYRLKIALNDISVKDTRQWQDLIDSRVASINFCINTMGAPVNFTTNLESNVNDSMFYFEEKFNEWQRIVGIR